MSEFRLTYADALRARVHDSRDNREEQSSMTELCEQADQIPDKAEINYGEGCRSGSGHSIHLFSKGDGGRWVPYGIGAAELEGARNINEFSAESSPDGSNVQGVPGRTDFDDDD